MNELKTLKDIRKCPNCNEGKPENCCVDYLDLREDAIRDINAFNEIQDLEDKHLELYGIICKEHRDIGKYPTPETDKRYIEIGELIKQKEREFGWFLFCDDCKETFIKWIKFKFNITDEELK